MPPKTPTLEPTKSLLNPHPIPIPRPTHRTRRQVRQQRPRLLRPFAPKHHQSTPQPIPKRLPSKRHLLTRPRRTQRRQRTRPTPPQRTKVALRVHPHQRMHPLRTIAPNNCGDHKPRSVSTNTDNDLGSAPRSRPRSVSHNGSHAPLVLPRTIVHATGMVCW